MSDDVYGLDPQIGANGNLAKRSPPDPAVEIGLGSPRHFDFHDGQPLGDDWTIGPVPSGWQLRTIDGSVVFDMNHTAGVDQRQSLRVARPFDLNTVVTMSFWINLDFDAYDDDPLNCDISIDCGAGLSLLVNNHAPARWLNMLAGGAQIAESTVMADSVDRHVMMVFSQSGSKIYEDGNLIVSLAQSPANAGATLDGQALGNAVAATFSVGMHGDTVNATVGISNVTVVAGAPSAVPLNEAPPWQGFWSDTFRKLAVLEGTLESESAALVASLQSLGSAVRPWHLFRGMDVDFSVQASAAQFVQSPTVASYISTASAAHAAAANQHGSTFFVGIGFTGSYWVSGGFDIGFLFGVGEQPVPIALVLTLGGGGGIARGVSGHVSWGWSPLKLDAVLGFGAAVQGDMGELGQVGIGVSGNLPLQLTDGGNCGPTIMGGLAAGWPIEIAGYVTYTWQLARLQN